LSQKEKPVLIQDSVSGMSSKLLSPSGHVQSVTESNRNQWKTKPPLPRAGRQILHCWETFECQRSFHYPATLTRPKPLRFLSK